MTQTRALTFAERVAYQRVTEQVYWRHRIWPKENAGPKPPLDQVISHEEIQRKVEDYLRNSQALEDCWHRPISPGELQTEMDRMAQHTKLPDLLRELFEVLDNDPFVIAECVARPLLAQRIVTNLYAHDQGGSDSTLSCKNWTASQTTTQAGNYKLPETVGAACVDDTWTATSTLNAPDGRTVHTAVWTGTEMIVWGGFNGNSYLNTGGRYDPATDSWTATSTISVPDARHDHTAVWTGSEMIVWGGQGNSGSLNAGGRYNPTTDSWTPTSTTNAPQAREFHSAVWTGSKMIVWGGYNDFVSGILNTGGRYNPTTDTWTATSTTNAPDARYVHTAIWTGTSMIVWGGVGSVNPFVFLNTGGRYDPAVDSWTATSIANAPEGRRDHSAIWTGNEMIVWGGADDDTVFNTGGRYTVAADSWTATSLVDAPEAREVHTAVWTGNEMIVWGGTDNVAFFNSGARYDPAIDSWTATSTNNAPEARIFHTAVWTGNEMIVWGGRDQSFTRFNTGGKYCPGVSTPTPTPTATSTSTPTPTPCTGRCSPTPRPRPTPAPRPLPR